MKDTLAWVKKQDTLGATAAQRIADAFRAPLRTVFRVTAAGFIEYGDWLEKLHQRVPHGLWLDLFEDARPGARAIRPIPISSKRAQALMRIARHPILNDPNVLDELPPTWRTLDTLTRVPHETLKKAITEGHVHRRMTREDAEMIQRPMSELESEPEAVSEPDGELMSELDANITIESSLRDLWARFPDHHGYILAVIDRLKAERHP